MNESEQQRWLRGIEAAEAEELDTLDVQSDPQRDGRIADAVMARMGKGQKPQRSLHRTRIIFAAAALAAGVGIWVVPKWLATSASSLATLHLNLQGDEKAMGSSPPRSPVAHLGPNSTLKIDIQPEQDISGEFEVRSYLWQKESLIPFSVNLQRSPQGRLRGKKPVGELPELRDGEWGVVFVAARPRKLPTDAEVLSALTSGHSSRGADWQLLTGRIELQR